MPWEGIDPWWALFIGTAGLLLLALSLVTALSIHRHSTLRLRREKSDAVEQSERKFTELFNTVSDIVYVHSPEGVIIQVNPSIGLILGYGIDDVCGRHIADFLPYFDESNYSAYRDRLIGSCGKPVSGVLTAIGADGRSYRLLEYRSTPVMQNGVLAAVRGIARNVTEQLSAERSLRRSNRRTVQLLVEARRMQESLARFSRETIRIQEQERTAISRELHDEVGQLLATISVNLQIVRRDLEKGTEGIKILRRLDLAQESVDHAHGRIRRFLNDLRSLDLDDLGLSSALSQLTDEFTGRTGIPLQFSGDSALECLSGEVKIVLYRVIQESLSNVVSHSGATGARITVDNDENWLVAEISDDGKGFDCTQTGLAQGPAGARQLGLLGMKERVRLVHGSCDIFSGPGKGTRVVVRLPVDLEGRKDRRDEE
jgi:PAS domain S-box-containing protein